MAQTEPGKQETLLILQGGGSLGAYEVGVYRALEERGITFDVIAGVSIGAINSTILAGQERGKAADVLEKFWEEELAVDTMPFPDERVRRLMAASHSIFFGVPKFFVPRWFVPNLGGPFTLPSDWTYYYSTDPMKATLRRYVDFDALSSKPTRLVLTAVDVENGEQKVFDSYQEKITPEHVLASGSIPPAFSWTMVNGRPCWDGALVSNTPLKPVLDALVSASLSQGKEPLDKKIYIVNLFPKEKPLPKNMMDVTDRNKDILYSDKTRKDTETFEMISDALLLIKGLLTFVNQEVADKVMNSARYKRVFSHNIVCDITTIVHTGDPSESHLKDADFSRKTIRARIKTGYEETVKALEAEESSKS